MVSSICWNDGANMLAAMQDNTFVVWYHPGIVHADKDLLPLTLLTKEGRYVHVSTRTQFTIANKMMQAGEEPLFLMLFQM